jgi:hypothetical protein
VPIAGLQAGSYVAGDVVGEVAEPGRRTGYSSAQISPYEHGLAPLNDLAMLRPAAGVKRLLGRATGISEPRAEQPRARSTYSGRLG